MPSGSEKLRCLRHRAAPQACSLFFAVGIRQWQWSRQVFFLYKFGPVAVYHIGPSRALLEMNRPYQENMGCIDAFQYASFVLIGNTTKQSRIPRWILEVARCMPNKIAEYELVLCAVKVILHTCWYKIKINLIAICWSGTSILISTCQNFSTHHASEYNDFKSV